MNISNSDCGGAVCNCARPNVVANPNAAPCVPGTFFNTCAFVANTVLGTFGDAGRNIIRGPGLQNWDMSFIKQFPVHEQMRFEFRAELFNIWNHPNLTFADETTSNENFSVERGASQFGFPTASRPPRLVQFALKFYFGDAVSRQPHSPHNRNSEVPRYAAARAGDGPQLGLG